MFSFLASCWNYLRLCKQLTTFHKLSLSRNIEETDINEFVQQIIPNVKHCGCVCIKFCQWVTPILDSLHNEVDKEPYWLKTLERLYEDCPIILSDIPSISIRWTLGKV